MIRKRASLKERVEEIRRWAARGWSDERIAAQIGSSASSVQSFRSRHGIPLLQPNPRDRRSRRTPWWLVESNGEPHESYEGVMERAEGVHVWFDGAVAEGEFWESWKGVESVEVHVSPDRIKVVKASSG